LRISACTETSSADVGSSSKDARFEDQRARNRDPLALPARKLVRIAIAKAAVESHLLEDRVDARPLVAHAMDAQRLGERGVHGVARVQ
jgi:hypothetical protein